MPQFINTPFWMVYKRNRRAVYKHAYRSLFINRGGTYYLFINGTKSSFDKQMVIKNVSKKTVYEATNKNCL